MFAADTAPIFVMLTIMKHTIKVIIGARLLKWKDAYHYNKKDDAHRKHVHLFAIIFVTQLYFWCHVCQSASLRF